MSSVPNQNTITLKVFIIMLLMMFLIFVIRKSLILNDSTRVKGVVTGFYYAFRDYHNARQMQGLQPSVVFNYENALYHSVDEIDLIYDCNDKIGDSIYVYFPKGHPDEARVYSFNAFWFTKPIKSSFTIFFIAFIVALFLLINSKKRKNMRPNFE